jgi:hypothetical protein
VKRQHLASDFESDWAMRLAMKASANATSSSLYLVFDCHRQSPSPQIRTLNLNGIRIWRCLT